MSGRYAYSYDREDYTGAFETAEAALAEAIRNIEGLASPPTEVFIGRIVEADPQARGHGRLILREMTRRAQMEYGAPARKYLASATTAQVAELDRALERVIVDWLERNRLKPTFVEVSGVEEHPVPFPGRTPAARSEANNEVTEIGVGMDVPDLG